MPFEWKKPVVIGASLAFAAMAALVTAVGIYHWYSSRPQSWDASTIKGISTTVSQTFDLDEQRKEFTASGFMLVFILENTSGRDYTVPENLRLFERSSKTGALEELKAKFDHSFVVPAREKTEVHASVEYGCGTEDLTTGKTTERDGGTCFKDAFGSVTEFVGFDDNTHTRLNLPNPIYTGGTSPPVSADHNIPKSKYTIEDAPPETSQPVRAENGIAPDHGKPWERYAACAQASKLVPVCKQRRIALEDAKAAADGWMAVGPLPTIPTLPDGYNLDPGEANCRIVYQWDDYCRKQGMSK